jgi:pimeloyl-ACP methyl ester carboxylesterase
MVDCLRRDWHVIAPDWRGFGLTERPQADCYWFPDYLADLDCILDRYAPDEPVLLVGHSMGANVGGLYAGARPARIRRFVNLEGFGMAATTAEQAPARFAAWMDELRDPPLMRPYARLEEVAARLQKTNPRLTDERAAFLAAHWAGQNPAGQWEILGDPAHKRVNPVLYRLDEAEACWRAITAPVLCVEAADSRLIYGAASREEARQEVDRRLRNFSTATHLVIEDAGHMLHHDQPALLAEAVERFLA